MSLCCRNYCSSPPSKHQLIPLLSCSSETGLDHSIPSQPLLGDRVRPYWHPAEINCSFSRAQMFKFILGFQDHPIKASRRCPTLQGKGSMSQETQRKVRVSHLRLPEMPFSLPAFCKAPAHLSMPNPCATSTSHCRLKQSLPALHSSLQHTMYHSRTQAVSCCPSLLLLLRRTLESSFQCKHSKLRLKPGICSINFDGVQSQDQIRHKREETVYCSTYGWSHY